MGIKVGEWIAVTEDGVWYSGFEQKYSFTTKGELIKDLSASTMDTRRKPKVRRTAPGEYEYVSKPYLGPVRGDTYSVIKLTHENIEFYREIIEEQEQEEEE